MYKRKVGLIFQSILAGLLAVLFMVPVVYAQEDEFMLEEVTVTAEKRETNLQKTPISIQTVSGTELTTEAKRRIDEIMQGVVGVSIQSAQVSNDFYMRGLGTADYGPPVWGAQQSAVAVYIDGVYQNRGEVIRGGTVDMARAEVMRGTQSTTLGGSSLAGAVSMVSNDPVFNYEGSGSLGLGDYHSVTTQGVLNVPLSDNQAVRIAFASDKRDGYLTSNAGDSDQTNGRLKYRFQPTETFNIVATASQQIIGGNGVDMNTLTYYGYYEAYNEANAGSYDNELGTLGAATHYGHLDGVKYDDRDNPWDDGLPADKWPNNVFRHTNIYTYSADIDWDLGLGTLTMIPSYQTAHFRSQENPRATGYNSENRRQETTQFDAQLASSADAPFEWLGGLYYYDTTFSGVMYSTDLGETTTVNWESTDPTTQTTYAAYGNLTYPVIDVLRLNAGLRYQKDEKSQRKSDRVFGTAIGPDGPYVYNLDVDGEWDEVTYRVGAEYDVSDQTMVYALYNKGYAPGTWDGQNQETEAQTADQYTVGLKSRFLGSRLQLNVEGFHMTYYNRNLQGGISYYSDNYFALNPTYTGCNQGPMDPNAPPPPPSSGATVHFDNNLGFACVDVGQGATVPELYSMGVDLEINFLITENDRFDGSVEYLKSEQGKPDYGVTLSYLENDPVKGGMSEALATAAISGMEALADSYDGLTLQNSPEWSGNISYSHIFEMPDGSTLTPKLNLEYRGEYWSRGGGPPGDIAQPGESIQDAYSLYNFYLNWTSSDDKFNVSAYVKNIEDIPVLTNYGDERGMAYVTLGPPRTMGIVFSVNL